MRKFRMEPVAHTVHPTGAVCYRHIVLGGMFIFASAVISSAAIEPTSCNAMWTTFARRKTAALVTRRRAR
jgi:hypothetical protein